MLVHALKKNSKFSIKKKKFNLPCFSMSGIPATFEADLSELYKIQTIQTIKPTMLDESKVTFNKQ